MSIIPQKVQTGYQGKTRCDKDFAKWINWVTNIGHNFTEVDEEESNWLKSFWNNDLSR